MLVITITN